MTRNLGIKRAAYDVLKELYGTPEETLGVGWLSKNTCWRLIKREILGGILEGNHFEIELATRRKDNSWITWGALNIDLDDLQPEGFRSVVMGHVRICSPDVFKRELQITEIRGHLAEINERLNNLWPYPEELK